MYTNDVSYPSTGQMQFKRWYTGTGTPLDQFQHTYDSFGNVKQQKRTPTLQQANAVTENYNYDGLQRLTQSSRVGVAGALPINTSYSASGNLLKKSENSLDATGAYVYGAYGCGPHGVGGVQKASLTWRTYGCDANGNVVSGNEINAVYDFMNLPRIVSRIGTPLSGSTQFRYDANGQRYEEVTSGGETTRFGPKGYEKVYPGNRLGGVGRIGRQLPLNRHELGPVIVNRTGSLDDVTYVGRDRLGSTVSAIPSINPYKSELRSYDPFGNPREGNFADNGKTPEAGRLLLRPLTARGYTGHEHIDEGRVIHMNGRVYDYALGRFLGPDPIIQFPTNTQSLNPYSYIMNNPFAGTDPSGYTMSIMDRVFAKQRAASDAQNGCMGNNACNDARDSKFLQGDFRSSLSYGGAPAGRSPGNGAELPRLIKRGLALADKIGTDAPKDSVRFGRARMDEDAAKSDGKWVYPRGRSSDMNTYSTVVTNGINGKYDEFKKYVDDSGFPGYFNPSHSIIADLFESASQKFSPNGGDPLAARFAQELSNVDHPMKIIAHSQGTLTAANAASLYGLPQGSSFELRSPAQSYMSARAAIRINGGTLDYRQPWGDVANIYSPTMNPIKWASGFRDVLCGACVHQANGLQ